MTARWRSGSVSAPSPVLGVIAGLATVALVVIALLLARSLISGPGAGSAGGPRGATPVTDRPRVAVLSPALGVTLRDLDLEAFVVARHAWDMALDPSLPSVGDQAGLDYEALLACRPTHVLIEWGARPLPDRLVELAQERGIAVENFTLLTLDDIRASVDRIARALSGAEPALPARAAALRERMDGAWSRRGAGFGGVGRVLLLDPSGATPAALGPGSFHQQVLEAIGGTPAITQGSAYIRLDAEDVRRLAPDAIVLVSPRPTGAPAPDDQDREAQIARLLGRVGELDIPALRRGRVGLLDDPLAFTPSTAMIGLADDLARVLEGWREEPVSAPDGAPDGAGP